MPPPLNPTRTHEEILRDFFQDLVQDDPDALAAKLALLAKSRGTMAEPVRRSLLRTVALRLAMKVTSPHYLLPEVKS